MSRHPQAKAGVCSRDTCSSLLAKAALRRALTSAFIALNRRDMNMGALLLRATSEDSSVSYSALQQQAGLWTHAAPDKSCLGALVATFTNAHTSKKAAVWGAVLLHATSEESDSMRFLRQHTSLQQPDSL